MTQLVMMLIQTILVGSFMLLNANEEFNAVKYLHMYGYLSDSNSSLADPNVLKTAIDLFQERYNLTVTGNLSLETQNLLSKPRCGNTDNPFPFSVSGSKWTSNRLTWYWYGNARYMHVVAAAFTVWSKHTNLTFTRSYHSPNISLSIGRKNHMRTSTRQLCNVGFDGPGGVLAHAFSPRDDTIQVDVHIDEDEDWQFDLVMPFSKHSFYVTLIHEIGHALGFSHSTQSDSVMFPYYSIPKNITKITDINLSRDDIYGIHYLYGYPPKTTTTSTTSTTSTTTTSTTTSTTTTPPIVLPKTPNDPQEPKDICYYKNHLITFLVAKERLFAFRNNYVWVLDLDETRRQPLQFTEPKILTKWLRFLPEDFTNVSAIYERPNGEIAMFVGKEVYFMEYPSLKLKSQINVDQLAGFYVEVVNGVVSTNKGHTYVFVNNAYVFRLNECTLTGEFLGATQNLFHGIPKDILGTFKYTNGRLYFITPNNVYEYNEFSNSLTRSLSNMFDVLSISCVGDHLLKQLYDIVSRLTHLRSV